MTVCHTRSYLHLQEQFLLTTKMFLIHTQFGSFCSRNCVRELLGQPANLPRIVVSSLKLWILPLPYPRKNLLGESLRLPEIPGWRGHIAVSQMCRSEVSSSVGYLVSGQLVVSPVHKLSWGRSWTTHQFASWWVSALSMRRGSYTTITLTPQVQSKLCFILMSQL